MLTRRPMHPLRRDRSGVAMTEFALTLPIFLIALTGGIELTNLALVHLRLNHVAETAADNASACSSRTSPPMPCRAATSTITGTARPWISAAS